MPRAQKPKVLLRTWNFSRLCAGHELPALYMNRGRIRVQFLAMDSAGKAREACERLAAAQFVLGLFTLCVFSSLARKRGPK
jgi:hypothetical protein